MRVNSNGRFERRVDRLIPVVFVSCFVLMVVGGAFVALLAALVALFFAAMFTMTLIAAFADSTRVLSISPHWNFGHEGCLYFGGMILGGALAFLSVFVGSMAMRVVTLVILLGLIVALYTSILRGGYPKVGDDEDEVAFKAMRQQPLPLATWDMKAKALATQRKLSQRQLDVFLLLMSGEDIKAISEELSISQATTRTHMHNIYRKMGAHSQSELMSLVEKAEVPPKA